MYNKIQAGEFVTVASFDDPDKVMFTGIVLSYNRTDRTYTINPGVDLRNRDVNECRVARVEDD